MCERPVRDVLGQVWAQAPGLPSKRLRNQRSSGYAMIPGRIVDLSQPVGPGKPVFVGERPRAPDRTRPDLHEPENRRKAGCAGFPTWAGPPGSAFPMQNGAVGRSGGDSMSGLRARRRTMCWTWTYGHFSTKPDMITWKSPYGIGLERNGSCA